MIVHSPKNTAPLAKVYAFLSQDPNGNEGIIAAQTSYGIIPMVTGSLKLLEIMRPMATEAMKHALPGTRLVLTSFVRAPELDVESITS